MANTKAPKSAKKATAQPERLPSERIMLLLSPELVAVVDRVAELESLPGVPLNRQDAIRSVLAKLGKELPQMAN